MADLAHHLAYKRQALRQRGLARHQRSRG